MDHTVTAFEEELRDLAADVERLGGMAVGQLRASLEVVAGRAEAGAAERVIAEDKRLNAVAQEVERKAVRLIALRHPMADDLRQTVVALRCAIDLERCGDLAKNIAKRSLRMNAPTPPSFVPLLDRLGGLATGALEGVLQAYVRRDLAAARAVWSADDDIDAVHEQLVRALLARMSGSKVLTSNRVMALAVFCIWSMESSSELVSPRMSPRSKGVMKLRRTASRTSRATSSASCSCFMTSAQRSRTPGPPSSTRRSAAAPSTSVRAWASNRSKNLSSFGMTARNRLSMAGGPSACGRIWRRAAARTAITG